MNELAVLDDRSRASCRLSMLRFVHTADLQPAWPSATCRVIAAPSRGRLVSTLSSALAREVDADFVLVAGDLLDANTVDDRTVAQGISLREEIDAPIRVLPCDHDCLAGPDSVYARGRSTGRGDSSIVVIEEPDALVSTDDGRSGCFVRVLKRASRNLRIILRTCDWTRYRKLGVPTWRATDLAVVVGEASAERVDGQPSGAPSTETFSSSSPRSGRVESRFQRIGTEVFGDAETGSVVTSLVVAVDLLARGVDRVERRCARAYSHRRGPLPPARERGP